MGGRGGVEKRYLLRDCLRHSDTAWGQATTAWGQATTGRHGDRCTCKALRLVPFAHTQLGRVDRLCERKAKVLVDAPRLLLGQYTATAVLQAPQKGFGWVNARETM